MRTTPRRLATAVVAALLLGTISIEAADARPARVRLGCGQTITSSVNLSASVGPCSGPGVIIGADDITLDLQGYFVMGNYDRGAVGEFPGIVVNGRRNATIVGNGGAGRGEGTGQGTVEGFEAGVSIEGGGGHTVQGLTIQDNLGPTDLDTAFLGDGILVLRSGDNRIVDNTILRNGIYDGIGILAPTSDRNVVQNNLVADTRTGELDEFNVQNGAGIIVNNFYDIDQPDRGIAVFDNQMLGNTVLSNDGPGIATNSNINGRIIGNVVQNNGHSLDNLAPGNGIGVQRSAFITTANFNVLIQDNVSTDNGRDGIRIDFGPLGNRIINNRATGNGVPFRVVQGWDLNDMNRGCGPLFPPNPALNNIWDGNIYTTFSQPCVTAGGTFVPATAKAAYAAKDSGPADDSMPPRRR